MPEEIGVSINLADIERIARKLDLLPAFVAGVQAGGIHVKGVIDVYPPSTEANIPGPYPKKWYVRGTGSFWALKGGGIHSRRTSETLGRKWTVARTNSGLTSSVGNNVSYAKFVHDADHQPAFHHRRGWLTIQDVAKTEAAPVREIVVGSIREEIKKRNLQP